MGSREATGGYDPSGIDLEAWTILEGQLEATIPNYDRGQQTDDLWPRQTLEAKCSQPRNTRHEGARSWMWTGILRRRFGWS